MSEIVVVRFLQAWRGYSAGELAGFKEEVVDGLKSKGFAEAYEGAGATAPKPKATKKNAGKGGDKSPGAPSTAGNEGGDGEKGEGGEIENEEKP